MLLENVDSVVIEEARWTVSITIRFRDGSRQTYVASADSAYAEGDGIWWGTDQEFRKGPP